MKRNLREALMYTVFNNLISKRECIIFLIKILLDNIIRFMYIITLWAGRSNI